MAFAPCPSCRRHVRVDEAACPFCGVAIASLRATPDATSRMSRARLFVFATTVGVTAATIACPSGRGNIAQPYGVPPRDPDEMIEAGPSEQSETSAIAPPATIEPPPPGTAPTLPNTGPTTKPTYPGPGGPVAMYGAPPTPNKPTP